MRLVYPSGEVEIDFLTGAFSNTTPFALNPDFAETPAGKDRLAPSLARLSRRGAGRGRGGRRSAPRKRRGRWTWRWR